jgi:hypothetical protein
MLFAGVVYTLNSQEAHRRVLKPQGIPGYLKNRSGASSDSGHKKRRHGARAKVRTFCPQNKDRKC